MGPGYGEAVGAAMLGGLLIACGVVLVVGIGIGVAIGAWLF